MDWIGWTPLAAAVLVAVVDALVRARDRRLWDTLPGLVRARDRRLWDTLPGTPPNRDLGPVQVQWLRRTFVHDLPAVVTLELAVRGHLRIHDPGGPGEPVVIRRVPDSDPDDLRPYEAEFLAELGDEAVPTEEFGVRLHGIVHRATKEQVWDLPWVRTYQRPMWPVSDHRDAVEVNVIAMVLCGLAGIALLVVDLFFRSTFGDLAMGGTAALVLGVVALLRLRNLDDLLHRSLERVIGNYTGNFGYSAAVAARPHENLPYAFSLNQYTWLERYAAEHLADADWYSYDGTAKDQQKRFVALGGMFRGGYPRPADVRSSSPSRPSRVRTGWSGGGGGGEGIGLDGGGGHGHDHGGVGGGDGGGHGGSW
ncbi:DUF2207 domain-containing protein [Actinomadura logoneensis]|uniref:hypothetical protein n=1 Tax=Actinomadura logoneensis TaxID=2293572 RepID=UPI0011C16886|nr:hypothetical protein [Actinomadura logoneensis]